MNGKRNIAISDILLLVLSIAFLIGSRTVFLPCAAQEDGSWMTCHWAGEAVSGLAAVMVVIALLHIIISDAKIKIGLSLAMIPVAILTILVPGTLVHLCMMDTMRCRAVMRPAATVFSVLIIGAAVLDVVVNRKKE